MKKMMLLTGMVALIGFPVWAQEEGSRKTEETVQETDAQAQKTVEAGKAEAEKLLRAIRLPEAAEQARQEGVPAEEVKKVLDAAKGQNLPAGETETIMVEETKAVKEKGQIDNFGSFVKGKLDEGLRGQELSEAIRAEHAARGKGPGKLKKDKQVKKQNDKAKHRDGMKGDRDDIEEDLEEGEEDLAEGEEAVREKIKAEKMKMKGKRGMKKTKEERPADNSGD